MIFTTPFEQLEIKNDIKRGEHFLRINDGKWIKISENLFIELMKHKQLTKQEKLDAAFEIKCSGILYQPEGCTQKIGTFRKGCGMCGKGNREKCLNKK